MSSDKLFSALKASENKNKTRIEKIEKKLKNYSISFLGRK